MPYIHDYWGERVNVRQHARAIAFNPPRHASQDIRERYNIPRMNIIVHRYVCVQGYTCMYIYMHVGVLFLLLFKIGPKSAKVSYLLRSKFFSIIIYWHWKFALRQRNFTASKYLLFIINKYYLINVILSRKISVKIGLYLLRIFVSYHCWISSRVAQRYIICHIIVLRIEIGNIHLDEDINSFYIIEIRCPLSKLNYLLFV